MGPGRGVGVAVVPLPVVDDPVDESVDPVITLDSI